MPRAATTSRGVPPWVLADYWDRLGGRDIVARSPVIFTGGVEVFGDELLRARKAIAATRSALAPCLLLF
jgi:hypothetical protein